MPTPVETYPALRRFRLELPQDAIVYEQGIVPAFFYVLLGGRVVFEVIDAAGTRVAVDEVQPGAAFGLVGAFSGRATSAAARTTTRTQLIAIPVSAAIEAFRQAPELALALIRQFANESRLARAVATATDPDEFAIVADVTDKSPAAIELPSPTDSVAVLESFNEQWFFRDEVECPVCRRQFSYLRVRASAVRPAERDSDFRVAYRTVDPSLYAVLVCPRCAYASYVEDFTDLSDHERRALVAVQADRLAIASVNLCGERTPEQAATSLLLAQMCADARGSGLRRRAGLLHRRAWLERTRGDIAAEHALLEQTRDAYVTVYEQDPEIQDAAALRVAYLIGDIHLRLGDSTAARRWLLECTRMNLRERQDGLLRMARSRLEDARDTQPLSRSA